MQRFWDKVEKTDGCWNWTASGRGKGYGSFKYKGKTHDSHRFVWFLIHGEFSKKCVLHICDNRKCVKPDHLFEGTQQENVIDMMRKGRQHSTPHGNRHKYSYGCRCNLCREAQMDYQRAFRKEHVEELNKKRREKNKLRRLAGKKPI